jgi:hypothetical protein
MASSGFNDRGEDFLVSAPSHSASKHPERYMASRGFNDRDQVGVN